MPPPIDPPKGFSKFSVPGVYLGENPVVARTITGTPTGIAAFTGPALSGPTGQVSAPLNSFAEYQAIYGGTEPLQYGNGVTAPNYLAMAASAYFLNGGTKLYISRVAGADGSNAAPPVADDYTRALTFFEGIAEIDIVAAPGGAVAGVSGAASVAPIHAALIAHTERTAAYRFAVLDPPPGCAIAEVQAVRASLDSKNAAIYYPWITIADPNAAASSEARMQVPPSGAICGLYASNDAQRGVFKAPANLPIAGALGFEVSLNEQQNSVLNQAGINCLRSFPGKGNLVWGARSVSPDSEWRYVNVCRYLLYLEHSIDIGTQWAIFETNNATVWTVVQASISGFLNAEWRKGALLGVKPEQAYFVRCDQTTMSQTDIDAGRLICLVGVAVIQPAEFVIFRISHNTSSTSS
ncbi:phage tail sheath subtilisin-like domain-containing protein [Edaphobacter sp. 12200R-103]|uniref:phage tail sheath family protein n=1 Tax=Edaphobacter sp. 12200R-103 TaxID=2703788 RepID=UPI00138D6CD4|nr:phage tail sheath subtilisin-like domain-containing protein [Edaphobacter sp. 12200R-103]QHS52271.1 phage tail sheath family protein [Edaphobacter sp. 12200R-103]